MDTGRKVWEAHVCVRCLLGDVVEVLLCKQLMVDFGSFQKDSGMVMGRMFLAVTTLLFSKVTRQSFSEGRTHQKGALFLPFLHDRRQLVHGQMVPFTLSFIPNRIFRHLSESLGGLNKNTAASLKEDSVQDTADYCLYLLFLAVVALKDENDVVLH